MSLLTLTQNDAGQNHVINGLFLVFHFVAVVKLFVKFCLKSEHNYYLQIFLENFCFPCILYFTFGEMYYIILSETNTMLLLSR